MNMLLCVEEQEQDEERKKPWKNTNLQNILNVEPKVYETFILVATVRITMVKVLNHLHVE